MPVCGHYNRLLTLALFIVALVGFFTSAGAIVNSKIDRILDLSSQLVKITERITIEDKVGVYKILVPANHRTRLAYMDASIDGKSLPLKEEQNGHFEVDLTGKTAKPLVVITIYTHLLQPYPTEITQNERQLVRYDGLQTTLSPYQTETITTRIKLPVGSRLESFTKASKMTTGTNKLTYGPFKDIQPNQAEPLTVHFENNSPFVTVTNLMRTVEVSPWSGSVYVVNEVKVSHTGAKLKGPFSRIDYQRDHMNGISSVRSFAAELPKSVSNIYYRDGIGNISTSSVRYQSTKTLVTLKPRFPLFGGWGTDFVLGYRVPASEFGIDAPVRDDTYRLSIPFVDILLDNMVIDEATVKIILPAGASCAGKTCSVKAAIDVERFKEDVSYSYLDVIGRKVIVLRKTNLVTQHVDGKSLEIEYNWAKLFMVQEPMLLLIASIALLLATALWSKLNHRSSPSHQSNKMKSD